MKRYTISHFLKKTIGYGAILGLFLLFLVGIPTAKADYHDYIDSIKFYYDETDDLILQFYVKASFGANFGNEYYAPIFDNMNTTYIIYAGTSYVDTAIEPNLSNRTFIAGNTYKIYLKYLPSNYGMFTKQNVENVIGKPLDSSYCLLSYNFLNNIIPDYTSFVCYQENPILTIDFPNENQQILEAFNVHGSYYAPAGFTNLDIFVFRTYETASSTISYLHNQYYLDITEGQHNFSKLISDLPIGDYYLQFKFYNFNTREDFWSSKIINFRVLQDIPLVLGETSPEPIPSGYIQVNPDVWYSQNSSYATPTALFTAFSHSIAPVIASIGNYIYNFSSRFTTANAQETGERLGGSIVLARSYLTNLNSFFNDLPVGQFLLFYIIALVLIIIFRVIKSLINLIKP